MKKLLLAALFIIGLSSVASAQQKHGYSQTTYITEKKAPKKLAPVEPGYQSTVTISSSFWFGEGQGNALFVEYIGGYRFNNTLFLGAGIGLGSSLDHPRLGEKSHVMDNGNSRCNTSLYATGFAYRLYVNGRCYLSKTRLQPFLGAAIGFERYKTYDGLSYYDSGCQDRYYHKDGHKAGFYAMPEVGLNYRISSRTSAFLSIGYGATICASGLQVKLGATF